MSEKDRTPVAGETVYPGHTVQEWVATVTALVTEFERVAGSGMKGTARAIRAVVVGRTRHGGASVRRILHRRQIAATADGFAVTRGPAVLEVERLGVSDRATEPDDQRRRVSLTLIDADGDDVTTFEVYEDELLTALGLTLWEERLDRDDDLGVPA